MADQNPTGQSGATAARLAATMEKYLDATNAREEQLVEAVSQLTELSTSSQKSVLSLTEKIAQNEEGIGKAIDEQRRGSLILARILQEQEERIDGLSATGVAVGPGAGSGELVELLKEQRLANEMLAHMVEEQTKAVVSREAGSISGGQRTTDLAFAPYEGGEIAFLQESEVFGSLSDDTLRTIRANANLLIFAPGEVVFSIDDPVNTLYIVKSGIVEICRPSEKGDTLTVVAYFTAGDCIGETAIFLSERRSSLGRVPEGAEILALPHEVFMNVFRGLPDLALRLTTLFAGRLKKSYRKERVRTRHRELQGSLQYFDLATVVQTLLSSDERTGVLSVNDEDGDLVGELYFDAGKIRYAKLGHLHSDEAFLQLFQAELSGGQFSFKEGEFPDDVRDDARIESPGMSLLFEAARLQDELSLIREEQIPDSSAVFKTKADELTWKDDEDRTLANGIWRLVQKNRSVKEMLENIPRSYHSIYSVLATMLTTDQIE